MQLVQLRLMDRRLRFPSLPFDISIPAIAAVIILLGLSTIQSTIVAGADSNPILNSSLISVQVLALTFGALIFFLLQFIRSTYIPYAAIPIYVATIALLVLVLFVGETTRGSVRWISIGSVNLQPSSISVLFLIVSFSGFFSYFNERINNLIPLVLMLIAVAVPTALIAIEPDLGSALVLLFVFACMLHMSPLRMSRLAVLYGIILVGAPLLWGSLAQYQQDRLTTFMNPNADPLGSGYNVRQAITAVGSGHVFGRGWGQGTQSHLQFLPEQHTDFIFATYAEEQGFVGVCVLLLLYGGLFYRISIALRRSDGFFNHIVICGILSWFFIHIGVNIGMNVGLAPITGIPLPFMSYGGTIMVTSIIAIGLVVTLSQHQHPR
ncbi:rod shape-determining protein RodA [candidate division WWE3 bacterium CG_4_9_14_3_um_filter_41_6]|uniref:Rod shape-determining protein RodA n=1 Tax=candidate division WWE3 bacterium CG_4_10_14_0_2_um_filter_41_14 TaxID=1975072 RepID=A0A2M7TGF3_UNCKA|nr:MAG: rod shape-determining protein RodA [candidate division WWE3 bacterium CG_4_10_14_0_2_um_filter_41_14]PJA39683.1 MAG: rod shape-determining protein RodA [candidate division WWE3 bacterium CG_4_9_14_3_um_filter_41_6]